MILDTGWRGESRTARKICFVKLIYLTSKNQKGYLCNNSRDCFFLYKFCTNKSNKIRDLFKVKLYTIRSESKKKREREFK